MQKGHPNQHTKKNVINRTSICKDLAKRNEIDPFLKRMENLVTNEDIVRKHVPFREAGQTVAKPALTAKKTWKGLIY